MMYYINLHFLTLNDPCMPKFESQIAGIDDILVIMELKFCDSFS
jgi:hypothetical protein